MGFILLLKTLYDVVAHIIENETILMCCTGMLNIFNIIYVHNICTVKTYLYLTLDSTQLIIFFFQMVHADKTTGELHRVQFGHWVSRHCPRLLVGLREWTKSLLLPQKQETEEQSSKSGAYFQRRVHFFCTCNFGGCVATLSLSFFRDRE